MEDSLRAHPDQGDVVITTREGLHFLSVMPYPHRLSFTNWDEATRTARQWAGHNDAAVWQTCDGRTFRLLLSKTGVYSADDKAVAPSGEVR